MSVLDSLDHHHSDFIRWADSRGTIPTVSEADIAAARTPAGGWTRDQLAQWGVSWPPPKGWKQSLIQAHTAAEVRA